MALIASAGLSASVVGRILEGGKTTMIGTLVRRTRTVRRFIEKQAVETVLPRELLDPPETP